MKNNLFLDVKEVVRSTYYLELKKKKNMGFKITLSDIDSKKINNKVKKLIK